MRIPPHNRSLPCSVGLELVAALRGHALGALERHLDALGADLHAVHRLDRVLRRHGVVVADKAEALAFAGLIWGGTI